MKQDKGDKRRENRTEIEPSDMGHVLEARLAGKDWRFKVLNIGKGGAGILVRSDQDDVLKVLKPGAAFTMTYINPNGALAVKVETRHVTVIASGAFAGSTCVGFSISLADMS